MKSSFKRSDAFLCHTSGRASHSFPFLRNQPDCVESIFKKLQYISIYDSFCEELIHVICQLILFLVFCHLKTCLACVPDDVVFFIPFASQWTGAYFSQFKPIFPRRRIYRLGNLLFRLVTSLLFLPSVLRSSTIRFVTEQVDRSFTVFFFHLQVESRSLYRHKNRRLVNDSASQRRPLNSSH